MRRSLAGASEADSCKDVECSIPNRSRDLPIAAGRIRVPEDDAPESDSASAGFEFQKAERTQSLPTNRSTATAGLVPPFSKPAPSKWDDAQKWIASPTSNRGGNKSGGGGGQARKGGLAGYITRQTSAKVVLDAVEEAETKRVDVNVSHAKKETDSADMPAVVFDNSDGNSNIHSFFASLLLSFLDLEDLKPVYSESFCSFYLLLFVAVDFLSSFLLLIFMDAS